MSILQELRRTLRGLAESPRWTLIVIATLVLGIGATTAIFSVVHGVLLRPLPYPEPQRIVQVWQINDGDRQAAFSDPNYEDFAARSRSFASLAQVGTWSVSVAGGSEPRRLNAAAVSEEFFDALGIAPRIGRAFVAEELKLGGPPAAVVSYGFWQSTLGADPDLAAHELRFSGQVYSVVGVMPPGFDFPAEGDLWMPREQQPRYASRTAHNWKVVGRLDSGVALAAARQESSRIAAELRSEHGDDNWIADVALVPLHRQIVGESRAALLLLFGAVGFLLLVACANVTSLLLARAASRQQELALCSALGAGRWDLARPFLLEALVLSSAGAVLGVVLASWGVGVLLAFEPGNLPRLGEGVPGLKLPVLLFSAGISVAIAVALGGLAALRSTGRHLSPALGMAPRTAGSASGARWRDALVVAQLALTLVLLVGAGLLGGSLFRLLAVDPGFRTQQLVLLDLTHPAPADDEDRALLARLQDELRQRLAALPGVVGVGSIDRLPMSTGFRNGLFLEMSSTETPTIEDFASLAEVKGRTGEAEYRSASPGLFATLGIPVVAGRVFGDRDGPDAPHVAVISESLARIQWPGTSPLGKLVEFGNMDGDLRVLRIIGVVGDVRHGGLDVASRPTIYVNARQRPPSTQTTVLDVATAPSAVIAAARSLVRKRLPDVPPRFRTMEQVFTGSLAEQRFNMVLLGAFAAAALWLAIIGIYGIVAQTTGERTREIGVRMAIGARPRDVIALVVGQGLRLVLFGVGLGVVAAVVLTRFMASLLYEVSVTEPSVYLVISLLLASVALIACYLPARRAARVDPLLALRHD